MEKNQLNEQSVIIKHGEDTTRHTPTASLLSQHYRSRHKWDSVTPQRVAARVNEPN